MIKIMLKEPVGGGIYQGGVPARESLTMMAVGVVDEALENDYDAALAANGSLMFVSPQNRNFLVPARNIAYLLEMESK